MSSTNVPQVAPPKTYAFLTLGCKSNQYDTAAMAADLKIAGLSSAEAQFADVIVVNTCMVTGPTEAQCRQVIRKASKSNPEARIIVAGCMSKGASEQLAAMPEIEVVLEPAEKGLLTEILGVPGTRNWTRWPEDPAVEFEGRDRGFLKIQDGCDYQCSYCIVPSVRGPGKSLEPDRVATAVMSLMEAGRQEVVLTAIHLGLYGKDLDPQYTMEDLLERILDAGLPGRIRLSSMEPLEITDRLLGLMASSEGKICGHLHIPLQSGSDSVLARMNRLYGVEDFIHSVERAREAVGDMGIGCDVICGFPGERESDFTMTAEVIKDLEIPFLHAFPFSVRPGTAAARMKDDVPHSIKKERVNVLREIARENLNKFLDGLVGKKLEVVPENRTGTNGWIPSLADSYARVLLPGDKIWEPGKLVEVICTGRIDESLVGARDRGDS